MRLLDFIGLTVFFYIFYFGDKGSAFWKAVICEKGKHSELRRPSPLLALFPSWPRRCSALWNVIMYWRDDGFYCVGCETLCRGGCSGTVMRFSTCDARLRGYSCFRLPHFGSVLNCQYRSIQVQVSIFQHSTIAALYKKGPGVCRGARPCAPLRFSHISM